LSWQATHWNEDQNGNQGYPALDWEDPPPVRNTPIIPYQSIPYQNRKIPDENNRQPTVKYRIGKNRR